VTAASDDFVPATAAADIPDGGMKCVAVDRRRVVIARVDGQFYAFSDICGHRNAPLSRGTLSGHIVECPLHFAQFDIRDGRLVDGPVSADIPVHEVRVSKGTVFVKG
jgi:3-phenylpropionate/trans-cinnamate dioxygenase ferredoxin component